MDYLNQNISMNLKRIRRARGYSPDMVAEQTGSIWPAVFFHAANNGVCSVAQLYLAMDRVQGILPGNLKLCGVLLQMAYMSILLVLMSHVDRRTNSIIDSTT